MVFNIYLKKDRFMHDITTEKLMGVGFSKTSEKKWSYDGEETYVIDFYADWCEPCKKVDSILTEISADMTDVNFCKVNVDEEYELTEMFNIKNLPTIIIARRNEQPTVVHGAMARNKLESIIRSKK